MAKVESELPRWAKVFAQILGVCLGAAVVLGVVAAGAYLVHLSETKWIAALIGFAVCAVMRWIEKKTC